MSIAKKLLLASVFILTLFSQQVFALTGATQEQTDLSTNQPYGVGTVYQRLINVKVTPSATGVITSNIQFTLTNPDQIARVYVVRSSNSLPDPSVAANYFGTPIDNPGININFDGTYAFTSTSAVSFYLIVDIKPSATIGTKIDATCTSVTTTDGTFTGLLTTNDRVAIIAANLSGIKSVKSSGGDYSNLAAVISAINNFGIGSGGVTFNFADGTTFTHTVTGGVLSYIHQSGTAVNPLVLKQSGTGAKPIINCAATSSTGDIFIGGLGADYITIDGLDFRATGTNSTTKFEKGLYFVGTPTDGCNNNEIKNCSVDLGDTYGNTRLYGIGFRSNATSANGTNNNNKIHDCTITNVDAGIDFNDNNTTLLATMKDDGNEIYNNTIKGQFGLMVAGIKIANCSNTKIYNNIIDGSGLTTTYAGTRYGIATYSNTCTGFIQCYNNTIKNINVNTGNNVVGIYLLAPTVTIYNNMVSNLTNSNTAPSTADIKIYGIQMTTDATLNPGYNIWFNSVYLKQTVVSTGTKKYITAAIANDGNTAISGINLTDNIFVNESVTGALNDSYVMILSYKPKSTLGANSDNNIYYPIGTNFIKFSDAAYSDLLAYKTAMTNREQNSKSELPPFVSISDLHLTSETGTVASNGGKPVADVMRDIDGNLRSDTTPDIGADEIRVGSDGALNKKPNIDQLPDPATTYINVGVQIALLTGIDDGNIERVENITIAATSSDQTVVPDSTIHVEYAGGTATTAKLSYMPANKGIATIKVTLKDDRGTKDLGEEDTNTMSFNVKVINQNLNNPPTMGIINSKIYTGRGQQVIIVSDIDDGDFNKIQNVSISAVSNDTTILSVDSVSYKPSDKVGFIYVRDHSKLGNVSLQITLTDDGGTADGGQNSSVTTQTFNINTFDNPCANFVQYDVQQWQPQPTAADVPTAGSYVKICTTNTPIENIARNFFWAKMYGYIVPTVTDYYTFQGYSNEGFSFYLNLGDGISTDFAKLTPMVVGATATWTSANTTLLEAGKVYYFEVYGRQVVSTFPLWLKWSSSTIPMSFIADGNLAPDFDITKPSTPGNFHVSNLGVNDITVQWNTSTDNNKVTGYRLFLNGKTVCDSLINSNEYTIKGLKPTTPYSLHVMAVDAADNNSLPSPVVNVVTYQIDTIAPGKPTNLKVDFATAFAVKLHWNSIKDKETQTRGYNVYQNNILIAQNYNDTTIIVGKLSQLTKYSFSVSAVDANYNESLKSDSVSVSTIAFDPNETRDGVYKGRLTVNLNPLVRFNGFGINAEYHKSGMMASNLVRFGGFESPQLDTLSSANMTKVYNMTVSGSNFSRVQTTSFAGNKSAFINVTTAGGYYRMTIPTSIDKANTYLIRFAIKANTDFTGEVQVKLSGSFAGLVFAKAVTPTSNWQQVEMEMTTTYSGSEATWYLDFSSPNVGGFYLDNIQFMDKANYIPGSPYSAKALNLLNDLKPANIRWGGIPSNKDPFTYCAGIGAENSLSYGDWMNLANTLKCKTVFSLGIEDKTDFRKDVNTFKTFMEYLGGDVSTTGGALRSAEGYPNLLTDSKGLIIEIGNEVWGGASHFAQIGADYTTYGNWARTAMSAIKSTPYYDSKKVQLNYSGRMPGQNYGLHQQMLTGDTGEGDELSTSGYLGGNMNLDPNIPLSTSIMDYYKAGIVMLQSKFDGLKNDWKDMMTYTGRILPMYMYEGNMTQNSYYGKVGQAVIFSDFYSSMPLYGVPNTSIFTLDPGQWGLVEDAVTLKRTPLFYITKYINNYCTGNMLETKFTSSSKIYDGSTAIALETIGCKAFTDSTSYSVAMFSRDFEHDYIVQLDIPDNVGNGSTCKLVTIHGDSFDSKDLVIDEKVITGFKDSMLVTVPKYGIAIVRFEGIDQHFKAPDYYASYKKVEYLKLSTTNNVTTITTNRGRLNIKATVLPTDAFLLTPNWRIINNEIVNASLVQTSTGATLYATGLSSGNGTIKVVAYTNDGSNLSDTLTVTISNQGPSAVDEQDAEMMEVYPNPARDYIKINMTNLTDYKMGSLSVIDLQGKEYCRQNITTGINTVSTSHLHSGIYFVKVKLESGVRIFKFIKE